MASYEPASRHGDSLTTDAMYEVLSDSGRRHLLGVLASRGRTMTLPDLATEVCARDHDIPRTELSDAQLSRTTTALHHNHLPKLAEHGIIAYDTDQQTATPTETLDHIEPFLASVGGGRRVR